MKILNYLVTFVFCLFIASCESSKEELIPLFNGDTYIYFNSKGEIAVKPESNVVYATAFSDGLAMVGVEIDGQDRFGFLNTKGEFAIRPEYIYATPFNEGLAWVVEPNGAPKVINKKPEEVFSMHEAEYGMLYNESFAGFAKKEKDGRLKFGFINKKGETVIQPVYDNITPFYNGLSAVMRDGKWGYINNKGEEVISADPFTNKDFAPVATSENHVGIIDREGSFVINPKYEDVIIDGKEFIVKQNDKCGIIDKNGKEIIPIDFKRMSKFGDNPYTMATLDGKTYGIIDRKGSFKVNPQFDFGTSFFGNLAIVSSGGSFGLIDTNGKYIVNPSYKDFSTYLLGTINYYMVKSDFINIDAIVGALRNEFEKTVKVGIDTYHQVKEEFGTLSTNYTSRYHPSSKQYALGEGVRASVSFTFDGPVSKREYNYYERKYATVEYNPVLKTMEYIVTFNDDKAKKKSAEIAKAVDTALQQKFSNPNTQVTVSKSGNNLKIIFSYQPIKN